MKRYVLLSLILLCQFGLVSCVETKNVSAFASSVAVVSDATVTIIQADRATCARINAVTQEVSNLPGIGPMDSANCKQLATVLDAMTGINTLLGNYGKALGDVAQDNFVNYDTDVNTLTQTLNSLPAGAQPTATQISAISGLAGWVASLATERERQSAIQDAMVGTNGEMKANFHQVVALLRKLIVQYQDGLDSNAAIVQRSLLLVKRQFSTAEPVAYADFELRMAPSTQVTDDQKDAIKKYTAALDSMDRAFDAAVTNPTAREMLPEIRDFAVKARVVFQSVQKAYPGI